MRLFHYYAPHVFFLHTLFSRQLTVSRRLPKIPRQSGSATTGHPVAEPGIDEFSPFRCQRVQQPQSTISLPNPTKPGSATVTLWLQNPVSIPFSRRVQQPQTTITLPNLTKSGSATMTFRLQNPISVNFSQFRCDEPKLSSV